MTEECKSCYSAGFEAAKALFQNQIPEPSKKLSEITDADCLAIADIFGGGSHLHPDSRVVQVRELIGKIGSAQTNIPGARWIKAAAYLMKKGYDMSEFGLNQATDGSRWVPVDERMPAPNPFQTIELCCDLGGEQYYYCLGICVGKFEVETSPDDSYGEAWYDENEDGESFLKPGIYEVVNTDDIQSEFDVWHLKRDVKFWKYPTPLPEKPLK